jgi:hypothetical protein
MLWEDCADWARTLRAAGSDFSLRGKVHREATRLHSLEPKTPQKMPFGARKVCHEPYTLNPEPRTLNPEP